MTFLWLRIPPIFPLRKKATLSSLFGTAGSTIPAAMMRVAEPSLFLPHVAQRSLRFSHEE
jgi:hypothetical protein